MKIFPEQLTSHVSQGKLTLQIAGEWTGGYDVETQNYFQHPIGTTSIEIPDNWVSYLRNNDGPKCGREHGIPYFSKAGYEANKDLLRSSFRSTYYMWKDFEVCVEKHFESVEIQLEKKKKKFRKMLDDLEKFVL